MAKSSSPEKEQLRAGTLGNGWAQCLWYHLGPSDGKKLVAHELCPPWSQETHSIHFLSEPSSQMMSEKGRSYICMFKTFCFASLFLICSLLFFTTTLKLVELDVAIPFHRWGTKSYERPDQKSPMLRQSGLHTALQCVTQGTGNQAGVPWCHYQWKSPHYCL